ncbi:MAG: carbohydrate kinase [Clostridia bacterium]|nr:carbohydrate kinase [Clostridia bacterium]
MNRKTMLTAIGEALIDFIPDRTGCSFDDVNAFAPKVGGAPTNVCGAFAKLGGHARLITQVGDDPFGHRILHTLKDAGVDTSCVLTTDKANTMLAFVSLQEDGNRTFSFYRKPSADTLFSADQIERRWFDDAYALHFCTVSLGDYPFRDAHRAAIRYAREAGALISFDPNLRFPLWPDREDLSRIIAEFLPQSDILKISDEELAFITGETDIEAALPKLFIGRVGLILYTCGGDGAHAYTRTAHAHAPSFAAGKVIDTTGAGDAFAAAMLWQLANAGVTDLSALDENTLTGMLTLANRYCGVSVTRSGAIPSYPSAEEFFNQ